MPYNSSSQQTTHLTHPTTNIKHTSVLFPKRTRNTRNTKNTMPGRKEERKHNGNLEILSDTSNTPSHPIYVFEATLTHLCLPKIILQPWPRTPHYNYYDHSTPIQLNKPNYQHIILYI
ncbi:hypothetical protein RND81_01G112500 [Saponaria officinalis]|uniref:Uncharacterized protein n=1 Tax=Saponaria officinalis TaxID=3572 RepID=A0AAW1NEN0_SAPOF